MIWDVFTFSTYGSFFGSNMLKLEMDHDLEDKHQQEEEQPESRPTTSDECDGQKPEFSRQDALTVINALALNYATLGDYLVVMNGKVDAFICGEPYLALQLWFNMVSGKFMSRVWSQTVGYSKVVSMMQFMEVCSSHFQHRPCVGHLLGNDEQSSPAFVVSQTPLPRRISRECNKVLDKDVAAEIQSCQKCLTLENYSGIQEPNPHTDVKHTAKDLAMKLEIDTEENIQEDFENKSLDDEEATMPDIHHLIHEGTEIEHGLEVHEDVFDSLDLDEKPKTWSRKRKKEGRFHCESCDYKTDYRRNLRAHVKTQHNNPQKSTRLWRISKECDVCGELFGCGGFHKHMLKCHGKAGKFYKNCDFCNKEFSTVTVHKHYKLQHNYGRFACTKCTYIGNFPSEIISHISQEHSDHQLVRCPSCHMDHALKDIEGHYKSCIGEKILKGKWYTGDRMCETCGKLFPVKSYLQHLKTHLRKKVANGEEPFEAQGKTLFYYCDKCENKFSFKRELDDHVQVVHDKVEFKCALCPLSFKTRAIMVGHTRLAHSSDKRYECEVCHKRFDSIPHKRRHKVIHEEAKFECSFCKKRLKTKETLEAHERYHTGEKPFKCEHCGNGYVNRKALRQHVAGAHKIIGVNGGRAGWKTKQKE